MKKHFYHTCILAYTHHAHRTVEEIYQHVLTKYPAAGKSTIYRNVEELVSSGQLQKIRGVGNKAFFESTNEPHAHLINTTTGEITDIPLPVLSGLSLPSSFSVARIDVRIYGE